MRIMKYKAKISSKGQVVIPKDIREKYGYQRGVEVTFKPVDDNRLLLTRSSRLSELFGFLGEAEASKVLLRERAKESEAERQRDEELRRRGSR